MILLCDHLIDITMTAIKKTSAGTKKTVNKQIYNNFFFIL